MYANKNVRVHVCVCVVQRSHVDVAAAGGRRSVDEWFGILTVAKDIGGPWWSEYIAPDVLQSQIFHLQNENTPPSPPPH